jgi:succinyl-CoA synthetase alpha subunit
MNVARRVRVLPGIEDAALVMGTEANKRLLEQVGPLSAEAQAAGPNDLIIMVKGGDDAALDSALTAAEELLLKRPEQAAAAGEHRPRTLRGAIRSQPDGNLVVVSVAGQYAAAEAWQALHQGLHVLLFSDNVSVEDEIALKRYAVEHGLLMMGPGAGTAIINGTALGFANVVPRGPVGIVSAAGTGLQEVSCLLAGEGVGISQGIGVGGRDLSDQVGGLMMLHGLAALQAAPETAVIVAISKLPSPAIAANVLDRLAAGGKPAVVIFMSDDPAPQPEGSGVTMATTLQEAALAAAALARGDDPAGVKAQLEERARVLQDKAKDLAAGLGPSQIYLRGLFSGGTLCEEAMRLWGRQIGGVWSNGPLDPAFRLLDSSKSREHCALDLGEEEFTVGRPHPMIDNDLRVRRLLQEAADPQVAAIQMDVVLGYGAHPDPAGELAPAIHQARQLAAEEGRELIVVISVTGTDEDPQDRTRQAAALEAAGALVLGSNADASRLAAWVAAAIAR